MASLTEKGTARLTDGQVRGSPFIQQRVAFDVSIVDPLANAVALYDLQISLKSTHPPDWWYIQKPPFRLY